MIVLNVGSLPVICCQCEIRQDKETNNDNTEKQLSQRSCQPYIQLDLPSSYHCFIRDRLHKAIQCLCNNLCKYLAPNTSHVSRQ